MDTIWVNTVVVSKQYLKTKFFYASVGRMSNLFPSIDVFKHTLRFKLKETRDVFRDIFIIPDSIDQFPIFFLPFLLRRCNLIMSCRWMMICQHCYKEKRFVLKTLYGLFLFASFFKYWNILFFLLGTGCFVSSSFSSSSNSSSGMYCLSFQVHCHFPPRRLLFYIFLWFLPKKLSLLFNIVLLLLSLILLVLLRNIFNVLFQFFVFLYNRVVTFFGAIFLSQTIVYLLFLLLFCILLNFYQRLEAKN